MGDEGNHDRGGGRGEGQGGRDGREKRGAEGLGGVRIGDAERQTVVDALSRHAGAGRLTLDEFAERAGQVFAARTRDDLDAVVSDLPGDLPVDEAGSPVDPAAGRPQAPGPSDPGRHRRRRWFVGIMSGASARGRWWAPRRIRALAFWGGVKIDLRDAVITSPVVKIKAGAYMGGVSIIVPEGIPVDVYGFVLMGGTHNRVSSERPIQGAPMVQVRARGLWGAVTVRSRPQRTPAEQEERRRRRERDRRELWAQMHGMTGGTRTGRHEHAAARTDDQPDQRTGPSRTFGPAGALPTPSLEDALPSFGDLHALAKVALRDKLAAAGLIDLDPSPRPEAGSAAGDATGPGSGAGSGPGSAEADAPGGANRAGASSANGTRIPVGTLTMLVTDIVRSTQHAEQLGDRRWMEVLRAHNRLVRRQVADHGGTEVKAQGDGFLCVFPSARQAILTAIEIQRAMAKYRADEPEHQVELRIGLHTGEVVADSDDIHGQNVVVAVRIADAAAPGEILVSGLTRDLTASAGDLDFGVGRDISLKGVSEVRRIHPVAWE